MTKQFTLFAFLCLFLALSQNTFAQDANKFDSRDLENLPSFYEKQVKYAAKILHIQDVSLSLTSVADIDIFYDYCVKRMDADWEQRSTFRKFADTQETAFKTHKNKIETNEKNMITETLDDLYKNSGLEHTSKEDMAKAVYAPLKNKRRRAKEVMRRMLIHDMVWHITDCKKALKEMENAEDIAPDLFVENSLNSYFSLLEDADKKTQKTANKLLKSLPKPPKKVKKD
jgi:hypothetical protein